MLPLIPPAAFVSSSAARIPSRTPAPIPARGPLSGAVCPNTNGGRNTVGSLKQVVGKAKVPSETLANPLALTLLNQTFFMPWLQEEVYGPRVSDDEIGNAPTCDRISNSRQNEEVTQVSGS